MIFKGHTRVGTAMLTLGPLVQKYRPDLPDIHLSTVLVNENHSQEAAPAAVAPAAAVTMFSTGRWFCHED